MRFISLALLLVALRLGGGELLTLSFQSEEDIPKWQRENAAVVSLEDGSKALRVMLDDDTMMRQIGFPLDLAAVAGKRLTATVSLRYDLAPPSVKWQGGKFVFSVQKKDGTWDWPGVYLPPGKTEWSGRILGYDMPGALAAAQLGLGIQKAKGEIFYRNLTVTAGDDLFDFAEAANMGFRDPVAGDGKGGWSDQGPDNDAAKFPLKRREFANVPFRITDPAKNDGKSILVFRSAKFPAGLEQAAIDFTQAKCSGSWFYLLHTLTWGSGVKGAIGTVTLTGKNGKAQVIEVVGGRDVADWWTPGRQPNAFPGAVWSNGSASVGCYVSRFKLDPGLGELARAEFRPAADATATWLVVAATVSRNEYAFPEAEKVVITEGNTWKTYPIPAVAGVREGTALDLAPIFPAEPAGTYGRVIVNADGRFAFEKRPNEAVRFFSTLELTDPFMGRGKAKPEFTSKERIEEYVRQIRRRGYNMVRLHYIDAVLLRGAKEDLTFRADYLDMLDYFAYCLKANGIYINFDAMSSRIGYSAGYAWAPSKTDQRNFKLEIHFDPVVRDNWFRGVEKWLTRVNPYTKTRLVDDPVLALAVCFNEQEFAFGRSGEYPAATPRWRAFLEAKYGSIEALQKSWGTKEIAFSGIAGLVDADLHGSTPRSRDAAEFLTGVEREFYDWCRVSLRKIGFAGPVANYNMGQSLRYIDVRKEADFVALNGYHAHPHGDSITQQSSIELAGQIARGFSSVKPYRKPLMNTEAGHAFWNNYRYEQAFVTAGYAAFNDFGGLTPFATQITTFSEPLAASTFLIKTDPVLVAEDFLMALLFRRGDVATAPNPVRLTFSSKGIYGSNSWSDAVDSNQSRLALVTGITAECDSKLPKEPGQVLLAGTGGAAITVQAVGAMAGYTQAGESTKGPFNLDATLAAWKKEGVIPAGNSSSRAKEFYESVTGELRMDCKKNFLSIDTPRLQGVCAEAGTRAALKDFTVEAMSVRGNLALAAVDGMKPIAEAERLVLVYATNALNSGMAFESADRRVRLAKGDVPVLIETGKFTVTLRHPQAVKFKAWALGFDGVRRQELPLSVEGGQVKLTVDTAAISGGPALFFELSTR